MILNFYYFNYSNKDPIGPHGTVQAQVMQKTSNDEAVAEMQETEPNDPTAETEAT